MLNIVEKRYWFFGLSLIVIIPGLIALIVWGLPLAIDFTGGSLLEVRFESGNPPDPAQVVQLYEEYEIGDASVQNLGSNEISARSKTIDDETAARLVD